MSELNPSVTRSSLIMASGTIISRMLGFARAVLLAAAIGVTTDAADAFGVANQLPNNVYAIIVGGVLNAVLVPQLVKARGGLDGGKGYVDRFVTLAITVFFSVTLLFTIAAPLLIRLYTSGWSDDQLALATAFAYWCLPQLFFYGLYSVFGEVLNSRKAFGPFMWAPVLTTWSRSQVLWHLSRSLPRIQPGLEASASGERIASPCSQVAQRSALPLRP